MSEAWASSTGFFASSPKDQIKSSASLDSYLDGIGKNTPMLIQSEGKIQFLVDCSSEVPVFSLAVIQRLLYSWKLPAFFHVVSFIFTAARANHVFPIL